MKHDAKIHARPENTEKQQAHKPPIQTQENTIPDVENLTQTGFQHLSPAELVRLNGMVGNRTVARLMAQRQEEDEGEFEGPRTKPSREDAEQRRDATEQNPSPAQRALVLESSGIGDAINVDGQGCYAWDRPMAAEDVEAVVSALLSNQSDPNQQTRIYIFSGTHGTDTGHLVNTGAAGFVGEDQTTANDAMANNPGAQIEVIDVPNSYPTKASLTPAFTSTSYIRILAWCYSNRSYNNSAGLKSNWWPEPDNI